MSFGRILRRTLEFILYVAIMIIFIFATEVVRSPAKFIYYNF